MIVLNSFWVRLIHLRTGVEKFQTSMNKKWGLAPTSICECGALDQIASYLVLEHLLHRVRRRNYGLLSWITKLDAGTITLLPTFEEGLP